MWLYVLIGIVICVLFLMVVMYNSFIKLNNKVKEAFSTMDVYLKKRCDLIPNIEDIVREYAKHEENIIFETTKMRSDIYDNMSESDKIKSAEEVSKDIGRILAVAENYPELKANENFSDLYRQLSNVEEDIANARKYYNAVVRMFNDKVEMFPGNIFAKLFGYESKIMFEVEQNERENIKIGI